MMGPAVRAPEPGDFDTIRTHLDSAAFNSLHNSPYYADAIYPRFTPSEYDRRLRLTRDSKRWRASNWSV